MRDLDDLRKKVQQAYWPTQFEILALIDRCEAAEAAIKRVETEIAEGLKDASDPSRKDDDWWSGYSCAGKDISRALAWEPGKRDTDD